MSGRVDAGTIADWELHLGCALEDPPEQLRAALGAGSIHLVAHATAARRPGAPALRVGKAALCHGELDEKARRVAGWLLAKGVAPGERVLLSGASSAELVLAYLGALHAGATVLLASPSLTGRELAVLLEAASPRAVLADTASSGTLFRLGFGGPSLVLDGKGPGTCCFVAEHGNAAPAVQRAGSEIAHLAFTSGTTGTPKATPLTHANLLANARAVVQAWAFSPDDVLLHALPLHHTHGVSAIHVAVLTGCELVVQPDFDPEQLLRGLDDHAATALYAVPTMWQRLLGLGAVARPTLSRLRLATSGSAPLAPRVSDAAAELLGVRPLERYGATEMGYALSNPLRAGRRAGSVGRALPGMEVAILDAGGMLVPDGEDGEIACRGPQVFAGYLRRPPDDSFFGEGWFATGDIGRRDPGSRMVSITGRSKELIVSGGMNVYPREVELVLESLPGVASAAVVGAPSELWGEAVTAFVVGQPFGAPAAEELAAQLAGRLASLLAPYKRPKAIHLVAELPCDALGKLDRRVLAATAERLAAEARSRSGGVPAATVRDPVGGATTGAGGSERLPRDVCQGIPR